MISPVLVSRLTIDGPNHLWFKASVSNVEDWLIEVHFIACYLLYDENFSIYNVSSLSTWVDDLLYVIK